MIYRTLAEALATWPLAVFNRNGSALGLWRDDRYYCVASALIGGGWAAVPFDVSVNGKSNPWGFPEAQVPCGPGPARPEDPDDWRRCAKCGKRHVGGYGSVAAGDERLYPEHKDFATLAFDDGREGGGE